MKMNSHDFFHGGIPVLIEAIVVAQKIVEGWCMEQIAHELCPKNRHISILSYW